jgi:hypothetical protein
MQKFKELFEMKKQYEEAVSKYGKDTFQEMFLEFFNKHTCVERIQWTQGTPGFNDGDPCTFSAHDPRIKLTKEFCLANPNYSKYASTPEEIEEEEDDNDETYPEGPRWHEGYGTGECPKEQSQPVEDAYHAVEEILNCEDVLEAVFGDGVIVRVYRAEDGYISIDIEDHYIE